MSDMEIRHSTKDIAEMLGIEAVTVRKYAMALEKAGYIVDRSDSDRRTFSEKDAMVFQQLKALRERSGLTVEKSAEVVAAKHREASAGVALSDIQPKSSILMQYAEQYEVLLKAHSESAAALMAKMEQYERLAMERVEMSRELGRIEREIERRIQRELNQEANQAWIGLSLKQRKDLRLKTGTWSKERLENTERRFIQQYIDERYEQHLSEAYRHSVE
jgi:DNA-binding transcriptional MerR regulator